jgi:nitrate/TMAO reductase-like tetraheme cytochrome c subunit
MGAALLKALLLFLLWPSLLMAQSLDDVISPGEVVAGHAKWESECTKCHQRFNKAAQSGLCLDCHKEIAADQRNRSHYHGRIPDTVCRTCHTEHKGRKARIVKLDETKFDHSRTDFQLKGAHQDPKIKCASCHQAGKKFRGTPTRCNDCHRKHDVHKGGLGEKCDTCHNEKNWKTTTFDHNKTRFKLENKHAETKCKECHQDRRYKDTPQDCYSCHRKTDDKDGHEGQFGKKCGECHTTKAWDPSTFDHDKTHFGLKGKHDEALCMACHKGILYQEKLALKCVGCHRKDDNEKGHKGGLGDKCESCHNELGWKTTRFDHDKDTKYPLTGKHAKAKCEGCHKGGVTVVAGKLPDKLSQECISCHRKDDTENKNGHKGKFGEKCATCHTTDEWKKSTFNHDRDTKYVLHGKHAKTACTACHTGILYKDKTPTDCISCHKKTDEEKGHKGNLGGKCADCHTAVTWKIEKFDHNRSRYPLTGGHVQVECKKCHATSAYRGVPMKCSGCHEKEDVHKLRLGTKCEQCHNTRSWKSWDFDHNKTKYRLLGAHGKVRCEACHKLPMQEKVVMPTACVDCHFEQDVHRSGFGAQCDRCHDETSWKRIRR